MKRASYTLLCGLFLVSLSSLCHPVRAQDPAKQQMRADIAAVLSQFVSAINTGNTTTAYTMISSKPNVTAIVNGQIYRGAADIANALSKLGAHQGHYQFILGTMDIANVNGLGLATGPYTMRHPDNKTVTGSATFLLENHKGVGWVITHINLSRQSS
jgi:hypothetical protein